MSNTPIIIFENDDVVVVNKPAGLMVHEDGFSEAPTVVDWLLQHAPGAKGVGEPGISPQGKELERSGVVHRLDFETSGILILAKNQEAFAHLKKQFQDRLVRKEYRALVYGNMKDKWGTIDRPIGRSARDFRRRSAQRGAKGMLREALTEWECSKNGVYEGEKFAELILKPKTGRTHQLRVHLKAVDHPIVGDRLYAGNKMAQSTNLGHKGLALHAYTLDITLPDGTHSQYMAPIPGAFAEAAARIAPLN